MTKKKKRVKLEQISNIKYSMIFKDQTKVLLNLKTKINTIR